MASLNPNPRRTVTPDDLEPQKPLSPKDAFAKEANQLIDARVAEVVERVTKEMNANRRKQIKLTAGHSDAALEDHDRFSRVGAAAEARASAEMKTQRPLFPEISANLASRGVAVPAEYVMADVEAKLQSIFAESMKLSVVHAMNSCYRAVINAELREAERSKQKLKAEQDQLALDARRLKLDEERARTAAAARLAGSRSEPAAKTETAKPWLASEQSGIREQEAWISADRVNYFSHALSQDSIDLNTWIQNSGLKDPSPLVAGEAERFEADLAKLRKVGVWKDPEDTRGLYSRFFTNPSYFKTCRALMVGSWAATAAVIVGAAVGMGQASLLFWAPAATFSNLAVQKIIQVNHNQKLSGMFDKIKRELEAASSMQSGIAWSGIMIKFLKDYCPLLLNPERTDLLQDHESTTIPALVQHLRQAAAFAAQAIHTDGSRHDQDAYYHDRKFSGRVQMNESTFKALIERWKAFPDRSVGLAKLGAAVGLFGGWVSIF